MHIIATLFAYSFYTFIKNKIRSDYYLGLSWAVMIIVYFTFFLIPSMICMRVLVGTTEKLNLFYTYKSVITTLIYEIFTTTAVTTLYFVSFSIRKTLQKRNEELLIAKEKAEESDKLKAAFLQNISHEIRTPLNGIVGFINLLASNKHSKENVEKYTGIINNKSDYLLRLINLEIIPNHRSSR